MWQDLQPDDPGRIGPYRLRGVLGSGGTGRVFLGGSSDGQLAAVKVIRADLASDPEFRARFRREVTVARKVSSRFTALLIGADTDGPVPWLATAYVAKDPGQRPTARDLEFAASTGAVPPTIRWQPEPVTRTSIELPQAADPSRTVTSARPSPVSPPVPGRPGRHESRRQRRRLARPITIASMVAGLLAASAAGGIALAASAHQMPGARSGHVTAPAAAPGTSAAS